MSATIKALSDAIELARFKRPVYYLAKFVRTAGKGIESLYQQARKAGVEFVKYEDIKITSDPLSEEFLLKVCDGVLKTEIKTKTIYADSGSEIGERLQNTVKKLNLTLNESGRLTEDTYYLTPVHTSRRGVFHLTPDVVAECFDEGLDYIYNYATAGLWDKPNYGNAVIDGLKCVLCYNCYRACTHAALTPYELERRMKSYSTACEGCGVCASICPGNAITLEKEPLIEPAAFSILVLCCENSAALIVHDVITMIGEAASKVEAVTIPCGGYVAQEHLGKALNDYDKIMVAVCFDNACRHFDGSRRACAQTDRLHDMLSAADMVQERISVVKVSHAMPLAFKDELIEFVKGGEA